MQCETRSGRMKEVGAGDVSMMSLAEIVDDGEGRKGRGVKNVEGRETWNKVRREPQVLGTEDSQRGRRGNEKPGICHEAIGFF